MTTDPNAATGLLTPNGTQDGNPKPPRTHAVEPPPVYAGLFSAMQKETFTWENKSGYPKVDISFVGGSPLAVSSLSVGNAPVPATVVGPDGAYLYTVHYRTKDGTGCKRRGPFVMHIDALCRGCIP